MKLLGSVTTSSEALATMRERNRPDTTHRLLGDPTIRPTILQTLRERDGNWFVYQSQDLGSRTIGNLQVLKCGVGCTFKEPPARLPDTKRSINSGYVLVGRVDLTTGEIVDAL